jgi:hypothetical protein
VENEYGEQELQLHMDTLRPSAKNRQQAFLASSSKWGKGSPPPKGLTREEFQEWKEERARVSQVGVCMFFLWFSRSAA